MIIKKYDVKYKQLWNNFVKNAKNSHFFFNRDYMEYHSDRFKDFSLLFFDDKEKLIAILPANIQNNIVYSHQGLTFGGFLVDNKMRTPLMLDLFEELKNFLKKNNVKKLIYKCIPYIYHKLPSEEDRYALFINEAKLIRRDVSSTIYLDNVLKYSKGRKWIINKAIKNEVLIEYSNDFEAFWDILEDVLQKHNGSTPVHSKEEIVKLYNLFPENIKLFVAKRYDNILAGSVVFENDYIVHTQYLANSDEGRKIGALDLLIDTLINIYKKSNKKYFDFGISNENDGKYLNVGLIHQKEGFGARTVVHDFYELEIL